MNCLLVHSRYFDRQIALLEKERLVELIVEAKGDTSIVGNIYKGRVDRVLPGMQTAFVNIGIERNAFLHVSDVRRDVEGSLWADEDVSLEEPKKEPHRGGPRREWARIQELLREGQDILVQVAKDPMGTKGARVTTRISLPGRYLVLMPNFEKIGISRRIGDDHLRRRLRELVDKVRPPGVGLIVRTVSEEGVGERDIRRDVEYLQRQWKDITRVYETSAAPALLRQDIDVTLRSVRDLFTSHINRIVVDSQEEYDKILRFIIDFMPRRRRDLVLYQDAVPLFTQYGVDTQIRTALARTVRLKSGGTITIDETEALVAVDVNTGKFVGRRDQEETVFRNNLEAVPEIVHQIRLRNLGGLIIIDFIDMDKKENREKVYLALKDALARDKSPTTILRVSELGLVEMTRKRTRESLSKILCEPCPTCNGMGKIESRHDIASMVLREIEARSKADRKRKASVLVHPDIARTLEEDAQLLDVLRKRLGKKIVIKPQKEFPRDKCEVVFSYL